MTTDITAQTLMAQLTEWGGVDGTPEAAAWLAATVDTMNVWLARGDGIAVYTNEDMGHPELGDKRFVSYGSPAAQLETDTPPVQLPDGIGGSVNWRYRLTGTYRSTHLKITRITEEN